MSATLEQAQSALVKANAYRIKGAGLRREIASLPRVEGERLLADVIATTDTPEYLSLKVFYLLTAPDRRGRKVAARLCADAQISPNRRLRELTDWQRGILSAAVLNGYRLTNGRYVL